MDLNLSKKVALVCGSSQGIGAACARELAALGANVILLARNEKDLKQVLESLAPADGGHGYIVCDVADRAAMILKVNAVIAERGPVSILVNNTAGPAGGPITEAKDEDFLDTFQKHLLVNSTLSRLVIPGMKKQNFGRIINIISTSVKIPIPGLGVSNTIRGAVASWAKTLAGELAPFGITVNSVLPGMTKTGRLESLVRNGATKQQKTEAEVEAAMIATIPAARFAAPGEIAAAVAFFASPAASYITGTALPVDGGRTGCL